MVNLEMKQQSLQLMPNPTFYALRQKSHLSMVNAAIIKNKKTSKTTVPIVEEVASSI